MIPLEIVELALQLRILLFQLLDAGTCGLQNGISK